MHWIAPAENDSDNAPREHGPESVPEPTVPAPVLIVIFLCLAALLTTRSASAVEALRRQQWTVDGVVREAQVYVSPEARTNATPVVFAFHGHGGSMQNAARTFSIHTRWPEALVIYMQGLDTPGRLTDPEGKRPGWQPAVGDQGDRDLKFFDAVLKSLRQEYKVDTRRIYATGHSNGGGFTYLLWAERADVFAAVAPSAAAAPRVLDQLKPKPVLHVVGEKDALVKPFRRSRPKAGRSTPAATWAWP